MKEKDVSKFIEEYTKTLDYSDGVSDFNRYLIERSIKKFYEYLKEKKLIKH